ncbi:MAG TPA: 2-oxo acid dehydrogenase subunit E2, partial [Acidimicrobiia bacterium]|nr:2-oxo acid dehydrogenase subunit E2 [Acidimicrobiia bacterium]
APASVAPASVAPTSVAPLAPVPDPPEHIPPPGDAPSGLATAAPLAPSTLAPQPSPAETAPLEPVADPPVAAPRAPEPHATLPVVFDAPPAPQLPAPIGRIVSVPLSTRAIADRMRGALDEMVQLSMHMDAWMDQAVEMRTQLLSEWDDDTLRPTYTDFVVRAVGRALVQHPELNAIVRGDDIELLPRVHVGITLPGRDGVDIPVVRDADRRTLKTIAAASLGVDDGDVSPRSLAGPASADSSPGGVAWHAPDDGPLAAVRASPDSSASALDTDVAADVAASFVVASLGIYGVDAFTPVVMSPNVATLAIGRVRDATRWEGDHPTRATTMTLTLAWDHRAVDGTTAAEFLAEVRDILEQPYRLLVD